MIRQLLISHAAWLVFLTTSHAEDPTITKTPVAEPPTVRSLSFSVDGTLLAVTATSKDREGSVRVWDVANRKLVSRYDQAGDAPMAAFDLAGKSLVVASGRKLLTVLDPRTGKKTDEIGPFPAEATALWPIATGRWLTSSKDGVFRLWDEKGKVVVHEFTGIRQVWGWTVSPSGKWLFVSGIGADKLWDLNSGKEVEGAFKPRPGAVNAGVFLADDQLLLGSNSGIHKLVEIPSGKEILRFKNEGGTSQMQYSVKSETLAGRYSGSNWAALTPLTLRLPTETEKQRTATLLKDCDSDDYATRERAAASLTELGPAIEPLLRKAMADGLSTEVRMRARLARETILNTPKFKLSGHAGEVRAMRFTPDGKLLATGGADGLVILWDPATGKEVARLNVASD